MSHTNFSIFIDYLSPKTDREKKMLKTLENFMPYLMQGSRNTTRPTAHARPSVF